MNKCPNCGSKIDINYGGYVSYKCGSTYHEYIVPPEYISLECSFIRLKNKIKEVFKWQK